MCSDGDDGGSDGDGDISSYVLELVSCCLLTLCEINTTVYIKAIKFNQTEM